MANSENGRTDERGELLGMLAELRHNLLITVRNISDGQARQRTTVSDLTLGGIVKHITRGHQVWVPIMVRGDGELPDGMLDMSQYQMNDDDTLANLLAAYEAAARATEEIVTALPDLDASVPLPQTSWSSPETVYWSVRRIVLHLIRETAQHAGHADIIRETLDGASTTAQLGA
jgi:uncharacterized damage-inducible protein DinB